MKSFRILLTNLSKMLGKKYFLNVKLKLCFSGNYFLIHFEVKIVFFPSIFGGWSIKYGNLLFVTPTADANCGNGNGNCFYACVLLKRYLEWLLGNIPLILSTIDQPQKFSSAKVIIVRRFLTTPPSPQQ